MQTTVPVSALADLMAQVAQISRRCERAGAAPVKLVDTGGRDGDLAVVELAGEPVRLGSWEVVCVIHHGKDGAPTLEECVPLAERERERLLGTRALCEACRTIRPRNQTLVLREAQTSRLIQVGTSCARTYTGADRPEAALARAQLLAQARSVVLGASRENVRGDDYIDLTAFLAHAAALVRERGYASVEEEHPTWEGALKRVEEQLEPTGSDHARAVEIRRWAQLQDSAGVTGYVARMSACLQHDLLTTRELGLAASAVRAYNQHLYREIRARKRASR